MRMQREVEQNNHGLGERLSEDFCAFVYFVKNCFICRPSDLTVSEDAGIEPRTAATLALAVRRSNNSARSHPLNYWAWFTWTGRAGFCF
jgi:hypothetical protein